MPFLLVIFYFFCHYSISQRIVTAACVQGKHIFNFIFLADILKTIMAVGNDVGGSPS